ncbi:MAG TPA: WbuC family cupin fold metalloprotein [Steroidobacteraceae bacterium]|nr:WbuC family cupin fold metalloprotein [Steroidobacteraceae bacterium]
MKLFSRSLLDELAARAAESPRLRANHNIHLSAADRVQRFFIAANQASYFRPHRHHTKSELAMVLRGRFDILTFDAAGTVTARHAIGEGAPSIGFETPQETWHTLIAMADGSTFLEIKEGPYDAASAAEFAAWAPPEGDRAAGPFLEWLRHAQPGTLVAPAVQHLAAAPDSRTPG